MNPDYFLSTVKKLRVLLVEDNPIYVKFIQTLFSEYAIKSDLAEDGFQAVEKVKSNRYDIVLMDIEMPVMNGHQATAVIRKEMKNDIPIIAMTANDTIEEHEKCITIGMNDCISKPVSAELLFEKMYYASVTKQVRAKSPTLQDSRNELINLAFLKENMGEKEDELVDIIDIFRIQLPKDVAELSASIVKSDYPGITHYAHRMKSTVSLMGATKIVDLATEIETLGRSKTGLEKINTIHRSLIELSRQALNEMQEERDRLTARSK